jgi:hypothetical protein
MEKSTPNSFKNFAAKRLIIGVILVVAVLWVLGGILGLIEPPKPIQMASDTPSHESSPVDDHQAAPETTEAQPAAHDEISEDKAHEAAAAAEHDEHAADTDAAVAKEETHSPEVKEDIHEAGKPTDAKSQEAPAVTHAEKAEKVVHKAKGVAFVEATIQSLEYELTKRFWGWRPNDIINITDNVNNYQLGVLEVTRRTAVALADRISRTGSADAYDKDLEQAMNWLMVKADRYWFPSPESKYKDSLNGLRAYKAKLETGQATFFSRADNLIPLLAAFEDLLGSCDENLVKSHEEDGSEVSLFKADDYFFYAKGIASAMIPILEAIHHDFLVTLEPRHGIEILHHAVESLQTASKMDPWLITDAKLDGILANHRANMAAPISHARFYIEVLIKTLST